MRGAALALNAPGSRMLRYISVTYPLHRLIPAPGSRMLRYISVTYPLHRLLPAPGNRMGVGLHAETGAASGNVTRAQGGVGQWAPPTSPLPLSGSDRASRQGQPAGDP